MPLTLQHICQYLPFGLKGFKDKSGRIIEINGARQIGNDLFFYETNGRIWDNSVWLFKPIVRPLSDITSQITHKGTELVISELFEIGDDGGYNLEFDHGNIKLIKQIELIAAHSIHHDVQFLPHDVAKLLHSYFIDTDGLIDSGLAISTHDLKEDPYK